MRPFSVFLPILALLGVIFSQSAFAGDPTIGSTTGMPLPRFASLKSDRVNLREGPSKDHRTKWIYQKAGLPVEITAEFETWRRIRDSDGAEGWVAPWGKDKPVPLHTKADTASPIIVQLMPNVVASIKSCDGQWCRLVGEGYDGWVQQQQLWGVYPGEPVE